MKTKVEDTKIYKATLRKDGKYRQSNWGGYWGGEIDLEHWGGETVLD